MAHIKKKFLIPIIAAIGIIIAAAIAIFYIRSPSYQIKQVLSLYFNGPNEDIIQSFDEAVELSHKKLADSGEKFVNINLDSLQNKLYGKYFTDKGLQSFWVRTEPTRYQNTLKEQNCTAKVNSIEVESSDAKDTYRTYFFYVSLDIKTGGNPQEKLTITGSAQRQQDGKLSFLDFHNLDNFYQAF